MSKTKFPVAVWISLALLLAGTALAGDLSEPEKNFEHLWRTFDRNYALFGAKKVDWDALYAVYRPQVGAETTDEELFDVLSNLLGHLNDNHVRLIAGERRFQSGILGGMEMEDFSLDLVKEKYLKNRAETRVRDVFTYGWLSETIGYFHFRGFGFLADSTAAIDEIVEELEDARGIVIDVRSNGGGDDRVGKAIADRFADRQRLYMTTRTRNGEAHGDFTAPKYWYVEPGGPRQFSRPVILLTHRFSVSAAENFALAMRVLPHVTVAGDATSGVFADVYRDSMPNGWRFSVSYKLFLDPTGFCWEGIGVPADLRQTNSKEDIAGGRDRVLELAMALIDSGSLKPQEESASLNDLRRSLVAELARRIERDGVEPAVAALRREAAGNPGAYFVDDDELQELWDRHLSAGDNDAALAVATFRVEEFPDHYVAHKSLGETHQARGQPQQARASYQLALDKNRGSYPWEISAGKELESLLAGKGVLARAIETAARGGALDAVRTAYRSDPGNFYVDENAVNRLGYRFLGEGKIDEAVAAFTLNVEAFPDSWNVYDSLGEALMVRGDREQAIENYQRSIELDPGNANGVEMLKQLRSGESGDP